MKRKQIFIFSLFLQFLLIGCINKGLVFKITSHKELVGIASASGIEAGSSGIFVIGDNSPFLFHLNQNLELKEKISLFPERKQPDSLFQKNIKPDLEALSYIDNTGEILYAFGSGSQSPERDILIEFHTGQFHHIKEYSLTEFYRNLILKGNLASGTLNIEACAIFKNDLFLFNRGENIIIKYSLLAFKDYIKGVGPIPSPEIFRIQLPKINGVNAGFSGATIHLPSERIIFTATVEKTTNWIDDGEVLGSFIGLIPLHSLKDQLKPHITPIESEAGNLKIKVESLTVLPPYRKNKAEVILVTDSDGGISEYLCGFISF